MSSKIRTSARVFAVYRPVNARPCRLRRSKRDFATVLHALTDCSALMYLHASAASPEPRGIAQALPLIIVIGPPLRFVKNLAVMSTGAPSASTLYQKLSKGVAPIWLLDIGLRRPK